MKKKYNYYFKLGKDKTLLSNENEVISVKIDDPDGEESIIAGEIACFYSFENELEVNLKRIGFKEGFLKKNIAFVGLKPNSTANTKRNIFDSFENIGFNEVYLIDEQIAILYELRDEKEGLEEVIIINIEPDRFDCSLIVKNEYISKYSIGTNSRFLQKIAANMDNSSMLTNIVNECIDEFKNESRLQNCNDLILIGDDIKQFDCIRDSSRFKLRSNFIKDSDILILKGMINIAKKNNEPNNLIQGRLTI